ncbi:Predicted protein [Taphrina deformans PYCC 5710]|uniref:GH16 domain-containing protein n=1 Tax=Taphrina deformans (strain PYCC 5710 / ATCC 11124 / CBS 356.35 / IMI 108563 / JCM 9778 / NBRC 8474) TaxID=1097556 RepID=R4X8T1_TAPDE|nr:Predicted protein [Taphrina deformans PYCC 5710]|eukprot:CCG81820.1 Predicted protein [Taphrina deformans PYCC 5710]
MTLTTTISSSTTSSVYESRSEKVSIGQFRTRRQPAWTKPTEKFWLNVGRSRDERWARYIVLIGIALGVLGAIAVIVVEYLQSNRAAYVLVLHDKFDGPDISSANWKHEQELGGFVEGSFDVTTDSSVNSWIDHGMLHIKPTLNPLYADDSQVNLTETGQCTSSSPIDCYALQNVTGFAAIPNIQTARLKSRTSITYGKVEVTAKFPKGDWLFSTIGLDPEELKYGQFPASGQIDIAQNRGNDYKYISGGRNKIDTIVHFGSDGQAYADCASLARNQVSSGHRDFSARFHTFGLEWTPDYIRTWLDYPSNTILEQRWQHGFWKKAAYGKRFPNDASYEHLTNPWTNGTKAAPYDQPFHLTLRSNVGAVSGIFGIDTAKPWYDDAGRGASMIAFQNNHTSFESWGTEDEHTMYIKEVKMWQQVM